MIKEWMRWEWHFGFPVDMCLGWQVWLLFFYSSRAGSPLRLIYSSLGVLIRLNFSLRPSRSRADLIICDNEESRVDGKKKIAPKICAEGKTRRTTQGKGTITFCHFEWSFVAPSECPYRSVAAIYLLLSRRWLFCHFCLAFFASAPHIQFEFICCASHQYADAWL